MKKRLWVIIVAFAISFLLMAGMSIITINRFGKLLDNFYSVDHTNKVIEQIYKLEGSIKDLDRSERGYMLTRDTMYERFIFNNIKNINPIIDTLKWLTKDNESQQRNMTIIKSAMALRLMHTNQNIIYLDTTHSNSISPAYYEGRKNMSDMSAILNSMKAEENKLLVTRSENKSLTQQFTSRSIKALLTIFCVLTFALFILLLRELVSKTRYQEELQSKVIDLRRSHLELEQIAYAASHDLREPLRKIQVFSDRLLWMKKDVVDEDIRNTMQRISSSAVRMQDLIGDLVDLTNLTKQNIQKEKVNINKILKYITTDLADKIEEKNAVIQIGVIPEINGYFHQLQILFKALIDNAIKFSREGIDPSITIQSDRVNGHELSSIDPKLASKNFIRISVADNGIGFDNKFKHKLFQIFQRLHTNQSDYNGKGIGLALSQRIMANHDGYIIAHGHIDMGATFKLYFPAES